MFRWLLLFFIVSTTAFSQVIEGKIVDKETGAPIPFASVGVVGSSKGTSSNLNGQFSLSVSGPVSIKVTCVGYESREINEINEMKLIQLKLIVTQLNTVYIYNKSINPRKVVRQAFTNLTSNYDDKSFLQKFFYRQYNKSGSVYESLIEASVDVWKHQGYKPTRKAAGDKEDMRITQLRRSLDLKGMVQGLAPISLEYILQSDLVGYQTEMKRGHLDLFEGTSNLRTDFQDYTFTFDGFTNYDGQEAYKIGYSYKKDSVLTQSGYKKLVQANGTLFITTDHYAIIKTEDVKREGVNIIRTSAFYRKYGEKYYPYHFLREGENNHFDQTRTFHIELMSVEISHEATEQFTGRGTGRQELLNIPYDSSFWNTTTILKTTPLEDDIIHDLGGGNSLNKQFYLYRQYELNVTDGGNRGEDKFNWLREDSKGKRILYLCFWDSNFGSYLIDLEYLKRLNLIYRKHIIFVMISSESDEVKWKELLTKYNLFSDGIINYRIPANASTTALYSVKKLPSFIIIAKDGSVFDLNAKHPNDPALEKDFKLLLEQE